MGDQGWYFTTECCFGLDNIINCRFPLFFLEQMPMWEAFLWPESADIRATYPAYTNLLFYFRGTKVNIGVLQFTHNPSWHQRSRCFGRIVRQPSLYVPLYRFRLVPSRVWAFDLGCSNVMSKLQTSSWNQLCII